MSLRDLIHAEAQPSSPGAAHLAALRDARLYFQRPENPGFLVSETVEGPVVPVFTSWDRLALFAGACAWASTTATDLVTLLPDGVRALVNPLDPRPFVLDAETLRDAEENGDGHGNGDGDGDGDVTDGGREAG